MSIFSPIRLTTPTCLVVAFLVAGYGTIVLVKTHRQRKRLQETDAEHCRKTLTDFDLSVAIDQLKDMFPRIETKEILSQLAAAGVFKLAVDDDISLNGCINHVVEHLLRQEARIHDITMECTCCYDDKPVDDFCTCRDGAHVYCVDCIRRHAEALVFGAGRLGHRRASHNMAELSCIDNECDSTFTDSTVQRVMAGRAMERYNELQGYLNVKEAQLEDLYDCPSCGYQALCPEAVFACPECSHESCCACRKPNHYPRWSCAEAKERERKADQNRWDMEEAMTAALVRQCPNCHKLLIKDGGCNKLTCACGTQVCNVCKKQIMREHGYGHFCRSFGCKHESCGQCGLFSPTDHDDQQAIEAARRAGAMAIANYMGYHERAML